SVAAEPDPAGTEPATRRPDFADVLGQARARRAADVAAAGAHHLLLTGPPGTGKTMIASRLPSILPPLDAQDAQTVSAIRSVDGRFDARGGLLTTPPFENPHHTASTAAVVGGGPGLARPGAISRAHAGVLFLDEAAELPARVLGARREPLETGGIPRHRTRGVTRYPARVLGALRRPRWTGDAAPPRTRGATPYPARFQLVLASTPCPCGTAWGKGEACTCTPQQRRRYRARLSGPVLDRVDMRVDVGPVDLHRVEGAAGEPSAAIAARVGAAR